MSIEPQPIRRRRESNAPMAIPQIADRLPPHSIESEQGVLGCLLLSPQDGFPIAQAAFVGQTEAFYDMRHQALFDVLGEMYDKKELIDPITVQQYLRDRNQLEALGGMPYIAGLMNCVPSAANLGYYIEIVREKFMLRKMIQTCTAAIANVYEFQGDVKGLINELQKSVMELDVTDKKSTDTPIMELMVKCLERIDSYAQKETRTKGLMTGFQDLDRVWNGMKPGQFIILGARPSLGKSSLSMNIVENIAINQSEPCAFFSFEMEEEELGERLISSRAMVDGESIQRGNVADEDMPKLSEAAVKIGNSPIHICDQGGMTFPSFRTRLRKMVLDFGVKLVIIDYLQLFVLPCKENRSIEIGAITTGLKALAKELSVTIICLSQLNRDLEKENRRPRMSDLRDSGSVEQDADKILLLSEEPTQEEKEEKKGGKSKKEKATTQEVDPGCSIIIGEVPKNRGGKRAIGKNAIRFVFRKPFTRFETMSKFNDEDVQTQTEPRHFDTPEQSYFGD